MYRFHIRIEFADEYKSNIAEFVALFCRNLRGKTFRSWSCLPKTCLRESTGEQQTPISNLMMMMISYGPCVAQWEDE